MKMNKKAATLIELSVAIICAMIIFFAVSGSLDTQKLGIERMAENNDILFIINGIETRIKNDIYEKKFISDIDIEEYKKTLDGSIYDLIIRKEADNFSKVSILIGIKDKNDNSKFVRVYKKEVLLNE